MSMNVDHIKRELPRVERGEAFAVIWTTDDVQTAAAQMGVSLTATEARDILAEVDRRHDASIGINWDVIQAHIGFGREP